MADPKYIVGIDLGTTNSVVAYCPIPEDDSSTPEINIFEIPQLVDAGSIGKSETLPSFIFQPAENDLPEGSLELPWDADATHAVGEFARNRGAEIPNRLIASTKSWLCHTGVDRNAAILPWDSPDETSKRSPVQATADILTHIRNAWNNKMADDDTSLAIENQEIFLTVPASFDAVARDLTVNAAEIAGLPHITLLEEPQAAFYAWLAEQGDDWRENISVGDRILVCDVGGGTTDFSLIQASEIDGELSLERVAVGDHLLVGGDNMDIALAHAVAKKVSEKGQKLNAWQMRGLWQSCRQAKEHLYSGPKKRSYPITILGRGSSLIGGTIETRLTREDLNDHINEGFFPLCEKDVEPIQLKRLGMRKMGLEYTSDPAITHHLAQFLRRHAEDDTQYPTTILFNGGVMKSIAIRKRTLQAISVWHPSNDKIKELANQNFDLAVARGAAYYGMARRGKGIRIRAGLNKTYYIGIESSLPAVPGMQTPVKYLCVAPFGMEEGTDQKISGQEFGLVVGEQVKFDLFGSGTRKKDTVGIFANPDQEDITPITSMETRLDIENNNEGTIVPIQLEVTATEIGTLELWCVSKTDNQKWKLAFNVRETENHDE
ncbi:molecular chaperone DnaK [Candidatus Magnetomorum sp. HK-1]|nr:molecular chaperone DnaK [Candidatus Magnetomorum sp. HK-1]